MGYNRKKTIGEKMFITTAGRTNLELKQQAMKVAEELHIPYIERNKKSVSALQEIVMDDCIVIGKKRLELYPYRETEPFFFHPNSAMFRIKRLINNEHDPFLDAAKLEKGMTLLDCTLGLASDSIIASFAVSGTGRVVGIEGNKYLAYMVKEGLQQWDSGLLLMNEAMKMIEIHHANSYDFLKAQKSASFDVVYFDPMFEEPVIESDGIKSLSRFAIHDDLTHEIMKEAYRVARHRIVLKDHFRSERFKKYGFNVIVRKSAKFHFGTLEKR